MPVYRTTLQENRQYNVIVKAARATRGRDVERSDLQMLKDNEIKTLPRAIVCKTSWWKSGILSLQNPICNINMTIYKVDKIRK